MTRVHPFRRAVRITWRLLWCEARIAWARLRGHDDAADRAQHRLDLWIAQQRELRAARRMPTPREREDRPHWIERRPRRGPARFPFDVDPDRAMRLRRIDGLLDDE